MKKVYKNIGCLLSLAGVRTKEGRHIQESDLGILQNAAFVADKKKIVWVGSQKQLPKALTKNAKHIDLKGKTVLPGFVECHTHTVFAGQRAAEFEMRNRGVSYQEIAAKGGGILSTMTATRAASTKDLLKKSQSHVDQFLKQGVTCLEIKSGYGLDLSSEIKILQVIEKLKGPRILGTFLGAHAKPPEFHSYDQYLDFLADKVLPVVKKKKLSQRVDIFVESGFFSAVSAKAYLYKAQQLGFQICVHADQLSLSGGSDLAIQLNALSADHVIQIDDTLIQRFAKSNTAAVLLPAADLYMKCAYPPARKLIDAGARVALATDFNPGSSPTQDLALVGLLARLEMKMTLPEVIAAYTYNAAAALNLHNQLGTLTENAAADFICIEKDWTELFYSAGDMNITDVYIEGSLRHKK